jgi:DNA-binding LytR/AlgR family response regulator
VEAMANYIILHTAARKLIVYLTMKGILEKLPADRFLQVHKSFIINLDRIRSIQGNTIDLGIGEVTISQHYYDVTMKEILKDKVIKR